MATKLIWIVAVILPIILAVSGRINNKTEYKAHSVFAHNLSAVISLACELGWISATVYLVYQACCAEGNLGAKISPLLLFLLMEVVVIAVQPSGKDRPLYKITEQRLAAVEARMQNLESTVNALQELETGKETNHDN